MNQTDQLTVGLVQMAPIWLKREATTEKMLAFIPQAAEQECRLLVYSESLLPGYPFWVELTDGARFNSSIQKEIHAHYMANAVQVEAGHLDAFCQAAAKHQMAIILGCIERARDRGGHSLYCTLVYINETGKITNTHRKLMPTYEERLTWSPGDGHGLRVHQLGAFTVGGLNCWENWMPLARAALYALGEDLHVSIWPGALRNTIDLTRFIAQESRSYVISVCGIMQPSFISDDVPFASLIRENASEWMANGGTCLAAPDGQWVIEPIVEKEILLTATLDHKEVRRERQNFDPSGHYGRPDVTQLVVNRERQRIIKIID